MSKPKAKKKRRTSQQKAAWRNKPESSEKLTGFLEDLLETCSEGIAVVDQEGLILYINPGMLDLFGYPASELTTLWEHMENTFPDPVVRAQLMGAWQQAVSGKSPMVEVPITRKDGKVRWSRFRITHMHDGHIVMNAEDLTSHKEAEDKLMATQFALDHAGDAVYWMDSTARLIYVNDAACKALGYTRKQLLRMHMTDIDPFLTPENWPMRWQALKELGSAVVESTNRRKDGSSFPVEVFGCFQEFQGHEYNYATVRNITERKRAERALKESEERYRDLVDLCPDPVVILQDGLYRFANQAFEKLFGYGQKDVARGLSFFELVQEKDKKAVSKQYEARLAGKKLPKTYRINLVARNGTVIACETSATVIMHDSRTADLVIIRDISERQAVENALQESEEHFRNLAEKSPNMIFINAMGRVVYANQKCVQMMGYSRREFYGPEFVFTSLIAPESQNLVMKNFKKHAKGIDLPPYEYALLTKKGLRLHTVINSTLIPYKGHSAILGIVTDITELKQAQEMLQESATQLRTQKMALEEKNTALKEVLAQIESEKLVFRKQVSLNTDKLLKPLLRQMRTQASSVDGQFIDLLEHTIADLTSEFGTKTTAGTASLTLREVEICNMIRSGMSSKEVADMLHVSLRTVETHRNTIRKKLGISGKNANLAVYLQNME